MQKSPHSLGSFTLLKTSDWYRFHPFHLSISPVLWHKCQRVCTSFAPVVPQQGMMGDLIGWWLTSFWLPETMAEGTHRGMEKRKMCAIKQIKICAEYRDMLPRLRLDVSGTLELRPIGLSPGSVPDKPALAWVACLLFWSTLKANVRVKKVLLQVNKYWLCAGNHGWRCLWSPA